MTPTLSLFILLVVALGINLAMFAVAFRRQTDKLTDISYAVTFAVLALAALFMHEVSLTKVVGAAMVVLWATRLGGFLLYRISKTGVDHRFDGIRDNFKKFLQFWLGQGLSVWVILLPALLLLTGKHNSYTVVSALGLVIWAVGLVVESFADFQKFHFSQQPRNKGKWIDEGVWKYSRHPNYFGEITVWVGMYIFAATNLTTLQAVIGLASPLFIASLLLFVSGIPKLEKGADERWGKDPAYQEYKRRTSLLIPARKKPAKS
jgi:steroid 5-alpha reductase family enzyme